MDIVGYNKIENTTSVGCMAHSRRKYTDALKSLPKDADLSKTKVNKALEYFKEIYKFEKEFKDLTDEERYENRLNPN